MAVTEEINQLLSRIDDQWVVRAVRKALGTRNAETDAIAVLLRAKIASDTALSSMDGETPPGDVDEILGFSERVSTLFRYLSREYVIGDSGSFSLDDINRILRA